MLKAMRRPSRYSGMGLRGWWRSVLCCEVIAAYCSREDEKWLALIVQPEGIRGFLGQQTKSS
jgi:hypothetical protein